MVLYKKPKTNIRCVNQQQNKHCRPDLEPSHLWPSCLWWCSAGHQKEKLSIDHLVLKDPSTNYSSYKLAHSVSKVLIGSKYTQVGLAPPVSFLFSNMVLFHSSSPKPFWQKKPLHKDPMIFLRNPRKAHGGVMWYDIKAIATSVKLVFKQGSSVPYVIIDDMEICSEHSYSFRL